MSTPRSRIIGSQGRPTCGVTLTALRHNSTLIDGGARAKLVAGMVTRAYVFHSDQSVPPSVSWSTYQFIVALVER
jgi:hypothetical protein